MSPAWDSHTAQYTSTPRPAACAAASRAARLLPIPGGPTTFTTPPRPPIARSTIASRAALSPVPPPRLGARHLPSPAHQAGVGPPGLAPPRADRQQSARLHGFGGSFDAPPLWFAKH